MEALVLGAIGLGGLYTISQQEKENDIKRFQNKTNNPNQKYGVNTFASNDGATDMYLDQTNYEKNIDDIRKISDKYASQLLQNSLPRNATELVEDSDGYSRIALTGNLLSGEPLDKNTFNHNNMVPFFGARVNSGPAGLESGQSQTILDNMVGSGSLQINNSEQAPLFKPEDNIQLPFGQQVETGFYQSRVNPSIRMNNIKPFSSTQVGPGLNNGYTDAGSGGFNAGMESRNNWLPKTVNELRTKTNPKVTFGLDNHQGPANSHIKERGHQAHVNKHLPEKYFINSPDRYLVTTGIEKGQRLREITELKEQSRQTTTTDYAGIPGRKDNNAAKASENYEPSRKPHNYEEFYGHACSGQEVRPVTEHDYGRPGYRSRNNNRCTTRNQTNYGGIKNELGSIIAPIMDILRPSRKENVIGNIRLTGNIQKVGAGGEYVYNAGDIPAPTLKEMNEKSKFHLNIQNQQENGYLLSQLTAPGNQRDTSNCQSYGNALHSTSGILPQDAYRRQRLNNNKLTKQHTNMGNMTLFNSNTNYKNYKNPQKNNRIPINTGGAPQITSKEQYGNLSGKQIYDQCKTGSDRIEPNILDAFKQNPYTQSLNSY